MMAVWEVRYGHWGQKADLYKSQKRAEGFVRRYIALHMKDFSDRGDFSQERIEAIRSKSSDKDITKAVKWWGIFQNNWNAHQHDCFLEQRKVL